MNDGNLPVYSEVSAMLKFNPGGGGCFQVNRSEV